LLALLVLGGCSKVDVETVGQWVGGFVPETEDAPEHVRLRGFLQLYARKNFKLELGGPDQRIFVEGTWEQEGKRITLRSGEVSFENPTEEDRVALKLDIVDSDEARAVYGKPLVLDLNEDKSKLTGQEMELGGHEGVHVFEHRKR
jgi:hypothetical protein